MDVNDIEKKYTADVDKEHSEDEVSESGKNDFEDESEAVKNAIVHVEAETFEKLMVYIKEIEDPPDSTAQTEFQMMIVNKSVSDYIQIRDTVAAALCTGNTVMMEAKAVMHEVEMVIDAIKVNTDEDYVEAVKKSRPYAVGGYKIPCIEGVQYQPSAKIARAKSVVANYSHDEVLVVVNGHNYHQEYGGLLDRSWFDLQQHEVVMFDMASENVYLISILKPTDHVDI